MNTADYGPMAREYYIWNAVIAALQFWTTDLKVHVLSSTTEQVYNTFFYSTFRRTSKTHHVSGVENVPLDPDPVTTCSTSTRHLYL